MTFLSPIGMVVKDCGEVSVSFFLNFPPLNASVTRKLGLECAEIESGNSREFFFWFISSSFSRTGNEFCITQNLL